MKSLMVDCSTSSVVDAVVLTVATHPAREGAAEGMEVSGIPVGEVVGSIVGDEVRYVTHTCKTIE